MHAMKHVIFAESSLTAKANDGPRNDTKESFDEQNYKTKCNWILNIMSFITFYDTCSTYLQGQGPIKIYTGAFEYKEIWETSIPKVLRTS